MKRETEWVSNLLQSKFFGPCADHRELRKNEKNVFCVDCNLSFCKHCITSSTHHLHRWFQICKYVYHDVVRLQEIQKILDCSRIQTYKINGERAVHINPRPQTKDVKPSKSKTGVACEACGRHIQDLPNRFCSIACKVSTVAEKSNGSILVPDLSDLSLRENYDWEASVNEKDSSSSLSKESSSLSVSESSEEFQVWMSSTLKPKKKLRKRKGVPHRAPLN